MRLPSRKVHDASVLAQVPGPSMTLPPRARSLMCSPCNPGSRHGDHWKRAKLTGISRRLRRSSKQSSNRHCRISPTVREDRGGGSPLTIKDLDLYPQPRPTPGHPHSTQKATYCHHKGQLQPTPNCEERQFVIRVHNCRSSQDHQ